MKIITTVFIAAVTFGAVNILVPKEKKTLKYLISVVFLALGISLTAGISFNLNDYNKTISEYKTKAEAITNERLTELKKNQTKELIEDIFKKNNVKYSEILVFANNLNNNSIKISKVVIRTDEEPLKILGLIKEIDCEKEILGNGG